MMPSAAASTATMPAGLPPQRMVRLLWAIALLLAIAAHYESVTALAAPGIAHDAQFTYLPMARRVLADGLSYFGTAESYRAAPLTYLLPALLGADAQLVQQAYIWMSCAVPVFLFLAGRRLLSMATGLIAAWLYALSPLVAPLIPHVMPEPPFLMFTAAWLWCLSEVVHGDRRFIIPAAVAGSLSLLVRPVWLHVLLASIPLVGLLAWRSAGRHWLALLYAQLGALIVPGAFMAKNTILFGVPAIATGAGAALYLGTHPLTGGIEPHLLGIDFDELGLIGPLGLDHLTAQGDRLLRQAAWIFIGMRSPLEQLSWLADKASWYLFFHAADFPPQLFSPRTIRIVELCLAAFSVWELRRSALAWVLVAGMGAQLALMSLILYDMRYSVGTFELPLMLLAAAGLAGLIARFQPHATWTRRHLVFSIDFGPRSGWRLAGLGAVMTVIALGVAAGHWDRRVRPAPQLQPTGIPDIVLFEQHEPLPRETNHMSRQEDGSWKTLQGYPALGFPIPADHALPHRNLVWKIQYSVAVPAGRKRCKVEAAYSTEAPQVAEYKQASQAFPLKADGERHDLYIGATYRRSPQFPAGPGLLWLAWPCKSDVAVRIHEIALLEPGIAPWLQARLLPTQEGRLGFD